MEAGEIEPKVTDPAREDFLVSIIGLPAWITIDERVELASWHRFVIPRKILLQSTENAICTGAMVL